MKILVCFKVLPNPDGILSEDWENFSVTSDLSYAGLDYNCFDASALEIGLKLKEQMAVQGAEVTCTALSVSSRITPKICQGLFSVGFDEVKALNLTNREFKPREIARIISSYARENGADVIITGSQSGYAETGSVPYYISNMLSIPLVPDVETASFSDFLTLNVRENGALIEKKVETPIIFSVNNSPEVLRFATLKARMACRTKQADNIEIQGDEEIADIKTVRPKIGRECKMLEENEESIKEIMSELKRAFSDVSPDIKKEDTDEALNDFLKENALFIDTKSEYGEDYEELSRLYDEEKPKLLILPHTGAGKALAVNLSEDKGISLFLNADIISAEGEKLKVKKRICAANLEWLSEINLPAVITLPLSQREKVKDTGSILLKGTDCDKIKWLKSVKTLEEAQHGTLTTAPLVVICGAGMGNKENCDRARLLAKKLGAGFGLTRPAALNAWGSPNEIVGLSGSIISPQCALVLGAAGAGAFMLGIENAKKIIAVNTDSNALIFKNADVGIKTDAPKLLDDLLSLAE